MMTRIIFAILIDRVRGSTPSHRVYARSCRKYPLESDSFTLIRVRSLLIHVNNGAFRSSAKSFGPKTICRREQAERRREKQRENKKRNEKEKVRELARTTSFFNRRAHQSDSIPDDERRRGERSKHKTRLARLPISSISSTEDQRGIIGFFDVWEATSRF